MVLFKPSRLAAVSICAMLALAAYGCSTNAGPGVSLYGPAARADELGAAGVEAHAAGDYRAAIRFFEGELRLRRSVDDRAGEALSLVNAGRTLIALGRHEEARALLTDAVALASSGLGGAANGEGAAGTALIQEAKASLAKAFIALGDAQAALKAADESIPAGKSGADGGAGLSARLNIKATALIELNRLDEAAAALEMALAAADGRSGAENGNTYRLMAELGMKRGDPDGALANAERALEADRAAGTGGKAALDAELLGDIYYRKNDPDRAAFLYDRCARGAAAAGLEAKAAACAAKRARTPGAGGEGGPAGTIRGK